jgi:Tfp pilus assembly protein PilO
MKRLSSEKKRQLGMVAVGTLIALAGVWYGLIRPQQTSLENTRREIENLQRQLAEARKVLQRAPEISDALEQAATELEHCEEQMASGDYYAHLINQIRQFRADYPVDIPQFSTISGPAPVDLLPRFPYQQVSLTIAGTAYYHDLGRFLADFESRYPYWQFRNLELEPAPATDPGRAPEQVAFRLTVVALVRSGS